MTIVFNVTPKERSHIDTNSVSTVAVLDSSWANLGYPKPMTQLP